MTANYDPEVLQTFANQLYAQAKWTLTRAVLLGFVAGWVGNFVLSSLMRAGNAGLSSSDQWLLPLLGLAVGYAYGTGKAFKLRLEAQRTLCQLQTERNTRSPASTSVA